MHTTDPKAVQRELRTRAPRLIAEFQYAIATMPEAELKAWARSIPRVALTAGVQRVLRGTKFVQAIGSLSVSEFMAASQAVAEKQLPAYLQSRAGKLGVAASTACTVVELYADRVMRDPRREAPVLAAGLLGFMVGSGGLDGDGGIPDLDLLGGIGAHRSLFTHTLVAGIVTETLIHSLVDLAARVHAYLPADHDPLWAHLDQRDSPVVETLLRGVSLGLAYHFSVDATADAGGAYSVGKGIVPAMADDAIQAANALAEGLHAIGRRMTARHA